MTVGRTYYRDLMEDHKKIKDRTEKLKSQLEPAYREFKIIYYSDPESFFYSLVRFNQRFFNVNMDKRRWFYETERLSDRGRGIWNQNDEYDEDEWKDDSELYKDYATDKVYSRKGGKLSVCVFQDQERYEPMQQTNGTYKYYKEWEITRTIINMYVENFNVPESRHSLSAHHRNIWNLMDTYVGDDIIAYAVNEKSGQIHCLEKPKIRVDDASRLHSTNSPAVSWKWTNLYCLHGVYFGKQLFDNIVDRKLEGKHVISIANIEQRRVATDIYGIEKLMESLDKKLINKSPRGNELYCVNLGSTTNVQFLDDWYRNEPTEGLVLKYSCPSTGRIYFSGIPNVDDEENAITRADQAMAWKFGLSEDEYSKLTIEA